MYKLGGLYALCACLLLFAVIATLRWARRLRHRVQQQRDEEIFQLIDEWTKSLQQEVAERKQAQWALEENQQSMMRQERQAAVGQLTAGLAHEFNNIMTIVQGHASLLMEHPNIDQESAKSLGHITEGVERMAKLIRQMLAFSRKQVMQRKALDVSETLGHTSDMLGGLLGEQATLRFEIAPRLPAILADSEMFQQIIVNLVVNARDAMSNGGQLTIGAAEAGFAAGDIPAESERKAGRFVRLRVSDTGSGMDAATINHLFEPFFTTKGIGKGTGLGLATVYGMVKQHEGWIEVQSKVGQGTTFDIYFPVTDQAPEKAAEPAVQPEVPGGVETVLVVEDESVLRDLVREILTARGYRVLEAADGLEAIAVWKKNRGRIDLLLTDIAMPHGVSGHDVADKLRQDEPRLPVIFSSGHSHEMIERKADAGRGTAYLAKPYNPTKLARVVRNVLDVSRKQ
jgi:signal transduction histidine kinase/ActR/RegA family two-component response regulator